MSSGPQAPHDAVGANPAESRAANPGGTSARLALVSAGGTPLGHWCWQRVRSASGVDAVFAPGAFEVDALGMGTVHPDDEDARLLASLRLIARGTPPRGEQALPPFEFEHDVAQRVVALRQAVLPPGVRAGIESGDTVQVGLLAVSFMAPPAPWPDAVERPDEDVQIADAQAEAPLPTHSSGEPVLDALHAGYQAWLLDPAALGATAAQGLAWAGPAANVAMPDPLAALVERARPHDSLHELLVAPGSMDALMARVDALGADPGLELPDAPSVLHLFAPARGAVRADALASLTRREHHLPAADSAMRLPGAEAAG